MIILSKYSFKRLFLRQIIYGCIASSIPIEYEQFSNRSIWLIDGTLTGTITPGQSGHGSNDNEEVLHTCQNSRNGTSLSDAI